MADLLRLGLRHCQAAVGQEDQQFLPAITAGNIGRTNRRQESRRDLPQDHVAGPVAVRVVQFFEMIEVDHDQSDRASTPFGIQAQSIADFLQEAAVIETGQGVPQCLVAQLIAQSGV